jgi:hypothetical protein
MDADRFETLLRSLSGSPSRRSALGLLAGSALGSMLTLGAAPTEAKRKKKKKNKRSTTSIPVTTSPPPPPPPPAPTCSDGVKNGSETDVDCGGGTCPPCEHDKACQGTGDCLSRVCTNQVCQAPSCSDTVKNETETDIDCGGNCPKCGAGKACLVNGDCVSNVCQSQVCQPTCAERSCTLDTQCAAVGCGTCRMTGKCGA